MGDFMSSDKFVPASQPQHRHRIALVLGSGGVRSIAGVGVAEVLRRTGLMPDLIVGCSSGALFGATIACGMQSSEAVHAATSLWSAELTEQRRWRAYPELIVPGLAGFDAGFSLRDDSLIAQRLSMAFGDRRIEGLKIPMRIATTDACTGEAVVLRTGSLVDALRASMAVPFIFPSVLVDGRRLVDGVISDPTPVQAAADAEVVVTLGFEGSMPRRIDRASRLVAQASTALINNLQRARIEAARATGRPMVQLKLVLDRHIGLWETSAMPELFEAGCRAMLEAMPELYRQLRSTAMQDAA